MSWNVLIGAVCSIGGFAVAYLVFLRNQQKDSEEEGNRIGTIMAEVAVTSADNGKFLQVVNGAWAAASIPNANG